MIREIISGIFLISGFVFLIISAIGTVRLPDFFTRLHSSGIGETLGITLIIIGLIIYQGPDFVSLKMLLIVGAIFIANPVGTHLIGKAAVKAGHKPWKEVDHADTDR